MADYWLAPCLAWWCRYKALRLGKRSRDGLSGEATVVFSYGYGFEDDDKEGDTLSVTLGQSNLIPALASGRAPPACRPERGQPR